MFNLNSCELITLANIISISIFQELSRDELILLSGFFTILGDNLAALSANSSNKKS